jgi:hypothetical protein
MEKELQKYYEERFSMMGSVGWKDLTIDIESMIDSLNNIGSITDEKTLHFRRGEMSILIWLKNLRGVSEQAYEELNATNV